MQTRFTGALALMIMATSSLADSHIRPGLWEITTKSDLLALIPHIPSDQMQQITDLVQQYGLKMPKVENGRVISNVCITPEMAQQDIPSYFHEGQSGCTAQNAVRVGNGYRMDLVCANKQFQGNGTAQGTFTSPEQFMGNTEFDSKVQGSPVYAAAETQGRWIGEHCTAVNPLQHTIPAPKR